MKSNTKLVLGLVAVVVAVGILLGMGVAGRLGNGEVVEAATQRLMAEDSWHVKAELVLHLPERLRGKQRPFTEVKAKIEGDVVKNDEGARELTGTLAGEAKGRGNIFFADGDIRLLEDAVAFRLENLPVLLNPSGSLTRRWTYVDRPVLAVNNSDDIAGGLRAAVAGLREVGEESVEGRRSRHYQGSLTQEQEESLYEMLRQRSSGSLAWHQLARLLQSNDARSLDVWVDEKNKTIARIKIDFTRPLSDGRRFDFATLDLVFSDYGKEVVIDRPEKELTARPDAFANLFGTGEIAAVEN